jgi:hypothetical protein
MKPFRTFLSAGLVLLSFVGSSDAGAQTYTWNRQAFGQPYLICPTGLDTFSTNYWPNNNYWSQVVHTGMNCENVPNSVISQPSNWSPAGTTYPNGPGVDVVLGAPAPTVLDVNVTLNRLTIQDTGGLQLWGATLTANALEFQGDGGITPTGGGGRVLRLPSGGSMTKTAGPGAFRLENLWLYGTNVSIAVNSGSLVLSEHTVLADGGTFAIAGGARLDLMPLGELNQLYLRGTFSGSGAGTVLLSSGYLYGGYAEWPAMGGCTLDFPGSRFQWTGGVISGTVSGHNPVTNAGTITVHVNNSASLTNRPVFNSCDFINQGTVNQQDDGALVLFATVIHNQAGGTYDLQTDNGTSGGTIANAGLFRKSAGTGTSRIESVFNLLGGTVEVQSGNLDLGASGPSSLSSNGTFIVAGGSAINLVNSNVTATMNGYFTGAGAGTVVLDKGTVFTGSGSAIFDFPSGMFRWNGGTIQSGSGYFTNAGTIHIGGPVMLLSGVNRGTMVQSGGGSLTVAGVFFNDVGGRYDLESDGGFSFYNGTLENAGTLRKAAGTGTSTIGTPTVHNSGTIKADSGTLAFTGAFSQNAGTLELAGSSLAFTGPSFHLNGGTVTGSGVIGAANVIAHGGTVSPGNGIGTITVSGGYSQQPTATLNVEVGGRNPGEFDQLIVGGSALLGGTLDVTLVHGFTPAVGDRFQLVACGARGYTFATLRLPPGCSVDYRNDGVYLVVSVPPPVPMAPPSLSGDNFSFGFPTAIGHAYTVLFNDDLATANWIVYTNITGNGSPMQFLVPMAGAPRRFFRVREP